ncbi:MAG: DUF1858 domain-containing protein, partial [Spirochaetota bacterium]
MDIEKPLDLILVKVRSTDSLYAAPMTIELNHTIYQITEAHPETLPVFVDAGLSRMADRALRERFGSSITVAGAAGLKGLDPEALLRRLR